MTEQDIVKATKAELKEQADLLGVEYDTRTTADELRKSVADALGIALDEPKTSDSAPAGKEKEGERIWLKIEKSESDKLPVPIAVNGFTIVVQRGTWVHVKREFVHALQNAVSYTVDNDTGDLREMYSYPFQFSDTKPAEVKLGKI